MSNGIYAARNGDLIRVTNTDNGIILHNMTTGITSSVSN